MRISTTSSDGSSTKVLRHDGTGDSEDREPETVVAADEDELLTLETAIVIVAGLAEEPVESSTFKTVVEDVVLQSVS